MCIQVLLIGFADGAGRFGRKNLDAGAFKCTVCLGAYMAGYQHFGFQVGCVCSRLDACSMTGIFVFLIGMPAQLVVVGIV